MKLEESSVSSQQKIIGQSWHNAALSFFCEKFSKDLEEDEVFKTINNTLLILIT